LTGITVAPGSGNVALTRGTSPGVLIGTASFTATGAYADGGSKDLTTTVAWTVQPSAGATFSGATVVFNAPGTYTITATSGGVTSNQATIKATFASDFVCTDLVAAASCASFDPATKSSLQGTPAASVGIAYPLAGALIPSNLGPIQVHVAAPGTAARIAFRSTASTNLSIDYYGACEPGPGTGCYVTLPTALTQLLAPSSETEDLQIVARLSASGTLSESAPLVVNWAAAPLGGGLTYWSLIPSPPAGPAAPPNYVELDAPYVTNGMAVKRYDLSAGTTGPSIIWTDDGGPASSPPYIGAPQAWNNGMAGGHCIGCHATSNDGKYMALTLGGASTYNAANFALLDIQKQAVFAINPTRTGGETCNDPLASPTYDPVCYWEPYRMDGFATETAWGPNDDVLVNMYKSQLYLSTLTISGTTATATRQHPVFPTSAPDPYASDPFWSADGSLFAFTSFNTPAPTSTTVNPQGLNGDLKLGGQIAIATATAQTIHDDAKVLVARASGATSYYPAISSDNRYVVFVRSTCGSGTESIGANYGTGTCDGYDDSTARLWLIPADGGATVALDKADGDAALAFDDSFPRFGPTVGQFRGKPLYWIVFSSRRPYGLQLNTMLPISTTTPQLWLAGVAADATVTGDPSFAPVWLPAQNADQTKPTDNHTPQWAKTVVPLQ
jgi:hypothetical protein